MRLLGAILAFAVGMLLVSGCDKSDSQDTSNNQPDGNQQQIPARALAPVDNSIQPASVAAAPEPPRITTWLSASVEGSSSSHLSYMCNPFILGNPPGQSPVQYDRIQIDYLRDTNLPGEVTASVITFTNDPDPNLGSGEKRMTANFFDGEAPFEREHYNLEVSTLVENSQQQMRFLELYADSGDRIRVSLLMGQSKVLVSQPVKLPELSSLQPEWDLYKDGNEKIPGQRGTELVILLSSP